MTSLDDYIMVIDEILPQNLVDDLFQEYENSNAWAGFKKGYAGGETPATHILLSHPSVIQNSPVRQKLCTDIMQQIGMGFDKYHKKYSRRDTGVNFLMISNFVGLRLIKYSEGQSLDNHTDKYTDPDTLKEIWPVVTFTITLNDNYEGGELEILDGKQVFKPKPRQCIFFPANFLYPHEVKKVESGTRYALVGWFV